MTGTEGMARLARMTDRAQGAAGNPKDAIYLF